MSRIHRQAQGIVRYGGREGDSVHARFTEVDQPMVRVGRSIELNKFASMERARAWYASPAYAEALKLRKAARNRRPLSKAGTSSAFGPRHEWPCSG